MSKRLAEVAPAVPLASHKSPPSYTYSVPAIFKEKIMAGSQVTIPLGQQTVAGTVLMLHSRPVPYPTKPLTLINNPPLTAEQIALATWISTTMRGSLGYTLRLFFGPPGPSLPAGRQAPKPRHLAGAKADRISSPPVVSPPLPALLPQLVIEKNDDQRYKTIQQLIVPAVKNRAQVLIVVPELRFVEPMREYLAEQLDSLFAYHSETPPAQLADIWHHVYHGKEATIIGTQKALFLPWRHLSHVVLEEEYLDTHKLWDQYPRLDNRDALPQLAAIHGSQLLYSGSWPSLARSYDQKRGRLKLVRYKPVLPKPAIVPLSFDDRRKGHLLPPEAIQHLTGAVRQRERTLILHNQRGSWRTAMCMKCHQALRCPECGSTVFVAGTKSAQKIQCRQCTYTAPLPSGCPHCQSKKIQVFGPGTAKMANIVRLILPRAAIVEVTAGSEVTPEQFKKADVVVGTTAVWRYTADFQFDRALWLFPESTLFYPDYRSHERALGLLAQLKKTIPARRRVLLVTRYTDLIQGSLAVSPDKIIAPLLRERERLHYPPYTDLVRLTSYGRSEVAVLAQGRGIREKIDAILPANVTVRGPYQGFNKKEGRHFAVHLLLAGPLADLTPLYQNLPINRAELSPGQIL